MRKLIAAGAALTALAFAGMTPVQADGDIRDLPFAFTQTDLKNSDFGEPSLALSAKDHVFICGPLGVPGGSNQFLRSADWTTWSAKTITDRGGGGDCDVRVGADGAVYTANLQIWASAIRKSTDDGVTFDTMATEDAVEQDRQWLATDPSDPNIVYLGYHDWSIAAIIVAKSIDGGATFLIHSVVSTDPFIHATGARTSIPGSLRVDPTNPDRLYMVWTIGEAADCVTDPVARCVGLTHRTLVVGRSDDGGLTWVNRIAWRASEGSQLGLLIPWLSVDNAGNVIVATGARLQTAPGVFENGMYIATSTDRADTWGAPVKVNAGSGAAVFPTVAAGADGLLDVAWIESDRATTDDTTATWRLRFAQTRNSTAASPTFTEVAGPILHRGDVCTQGLLCNTGGNRNLLDFIDMQIDRFGYAHIAATKDVNAAGTGPGARKVVYWRQDAGPSALSEPCDPTCVTARPGPTP